jgi:hypothetical protein
MNRVSDVHYPRSDEQDEVVDENHDNEVVLAIGRLIGGDPLAATIVRSVAAANPETFEAQAVRVVVDQQLEVARLARTLAHTRRQRQHIAIIEMWLTGDIDRARLLVREHLVEFPDDLVLSWLSGQW